MNRVCLIGRLTKDPELRTSKSGVSQTTFTIAVNRRTANEDGTRQADFINCIAWRNTAETIAKFFTKGREIALEGHIQTGSYEAFDGSKRYTTDVIVDNMTFIGNKETQATEEKKEAEVVEEQKPLFKEMNDDEDIVMLDDDDLPF